MMAATGNDNVEWYTYTGASDEVVPEEATHIIVAEDCTVILAWKFCEHPNVVEVICHENVVKIEKEAFCNAVTLRRIVMRGVKIIEEYAFFSCKALRDVECDKLEIIGGDAFVYCKSLRSIDLSTVRVVGKESGSPYASRLDEFQGAFYKCTALTAVKFGNNLERIESEAFYECSSLERITIPLKDGIVAVDDIFQACDNLDHVDLVEGELHETVAALQLEEWRNDMNAEIHSINQILPNASPGSYIGYANWDDWDEGGKAVAIRRWIRSVLRKIVRYQQEHLLVLEDDIATTLHHVLPQDVVTNNVLPFLDLPPHI